MKKSILFSLLFLTSFICFSQQGTMPDWARKTGAFGIGANTTLGSTSFIAADTLVGNYSSFNAGLGINVRTYISPMFGIQLTLNTSTSSYTDEFNGGEFGIKSSGIGAGVTGIYKLAYWQRGSLSALFGVDVGKGTNTYTQTMVPDTEVEVSNISIGLGLRGEWFPAEFLQIFQHSGMDISFFADANLVDRSTLKEDGEVIGSQISILGSDMLGTAGFTVWFN